MKEVARLMIMSIILHITKREQWEQAELSKVYSGDTLDSDGFIHCSTPQQVVKVANALFHGQEGLVLLCIESDKVRAKIKYESSEGRERYPHIYGPLSIEAVVKVLNFEPGKDGKFELPTELRDWLALKRANRDSFEGDVITSYR
jgi:uncharacterized protein (DUF952 family)